MSTQAVRAQGKHKSETATADTINLEEAGSPFPLCKDHQNNIKEQSEEREST